MVYLNKNISFNIKSLKKELTLEMQDLMDDYDHILDEKKVLSLKNKIEKKIDKLFFSDHFIYLTMNERHCTFKHKRGNNEGYFCCKNIRTNLGGQKDDYLCCTHSKKHTPKKRKQKKIKSLIKEDPLQENEKDETTILGGIKNKELSFNDNINIKLLRLNANNLNISNKNNIPQKRYLEKIESDQKCVTPIFHSLNINKELTFNNNNIYKNYLLNSDYKYETLFKDIPLLNFCINKLKRSKHKKNYMYNSFLY